MCAPIPNSASARQFSIEAHSTLGRNPRNGGVDDRRERGGNTHPLLSQPRLPRMRSKVQYQQQRYEQNPADPGRETIAGLFGTI